MVEIDRNGLNIKACVNGEAVEANIATKADVFNFVSAVTATANLTPHESASFSFFMTNQILPDIYKELP